MSPTLIECLLLVAGIFGTVIGMACYQDQMPRTAAACVLVALAGFGGLLWV